MKTFREWFMEGVDYGQDFDGPKTYEYVSRYFTGMDFAEKSWKQAQLELVKELPENHPLRVKIENERH